MSAILGRRLASSEQQQRKIGVFAGFPALGLDGLSSSAYGPEAALTILLPLGAVGLQYIGPITLAIVLLLAILYSSYRQTIAAYPVNGGSYTVAKENLGTWASLLAAAALMIDYVLTVAVGISAGVAALVSAEPKLHQYTLMLCLIILVLITLVNLRGTGEAGTAFAFPTYLFIACMAIVIGMGLVRSFASGGHPQAVVHPAVIAPAIETSSIWLLLRAFASGCAAMTGVEAVSNGVSAFKEPTVKNAHRTLTLIVAVLAVLLLGIAHLSHAYGIAAMNQEKPGYQSVLSQLCGAIIGRGWFYRITIASILSVLCLSANTSFVDFPRLCRLIAKDDFLPRSFATVGRRLVYSVGVLFLAGCSAALLTVFHGITDRLIPLYAVGAFMAFTLSQSGMVMHWWNQSHQTDNAKSDPSARGWRVKIVVNGIGAVATGVTLLVILFAKFTEGAWIIVVTIPLLLMLFKSVRAHYGRIVDQIAYAAPLDLSDNRSPVALLPMQGWNRPIAKSLRFAMHLTRDVVVVHLNNLEGDAATGEQEKIKKQWAENVEKPAREAGFNPPRLRCVRTPYREFTEPLLKQIDQIKKDFPSRPVAVIIPELVERHWWQMLLHSRRAGMLRNALRNRQDDRVVVIDLPWFVEKPNPREQSA